MIDSPRAVSPTHRPRGHADSSEGNPAPWYTRWAKYILQSAQKAWAEMWRIPAYIRGATWVNGTLEEPEIELTWQEIINLHWKRLSNWLNPEIPNTSLDASGVKYNQALSFTLNVDPPEGKLSLKVFRSHFEEAFSQLKIPAENLFKARFQSFKVEKDDINEGLDKILGDARFTPDDELSNLVNTLVNGNGHLDRSYIYVLASAFKLQGAKDRPHTEAFWLYYKNRDSMWITVKVG